MANQLALADVINVSVSSTPAGVNAFNTSNLAIFTPETAGGGFGSNGYKLYKEPNSVATDFGTNSVTAQMATAVFSQQPNILTGSGSLAVIPLQTSETLNAAIGRVKGLVSFFGLIAAQIEASGDMLAAAATIQANKMMGFFPSRTAADIAGGGMLDQLRTGSYTQSRGLYYGGTTDLSALLFGAAYAGRALSTNFSGARTAQTMHLKTLATIQPDPSLTETLYSQAQAAGADVYASVEGGASVTLTSGTNKFFDQLYNLQWFISALQAGSFNFLAQSSTKIPQTEEGMDGLKGAARVVCEQAVRNGYLAPGTWTSPTTFGNGSDLVNNIGQLGYYIYSTPIAQQSATDRATRAAPLMQIALKESGAMHSSSIIVNVNP